MNTLVAYNFATLSGNKWHKERNRRHTYNNSPFPRPWQRSPHCCLGCWRTQFFNKLQIKHTISREHARWFTDNARFFNKTGYTKYIIWRSKYIMFEKIVWMRKWSLKLQKTTSYKPHKLAYRKKAQINIAELDNTSNRQNLPAAFRIITLHTIVLARNKRELHQGQLTDGIL